MAEASRKLSVNASWRRPSEPKKPLSPESPGQRAALSPTILNGQSRFSANSNQAASALGTKLSKPLGLLAEKHAALLDPKKTAECLANVGELCFSERVSNERDLDKVARAFPKQVYEQVRAICERAEVGPAGERRRRGAAAFSLGPIGDDGYVDREILHSGEKQSLLRKQVSPKRFVWL